MTDELPEFMTLAEIAKDLRVTRRFVSNMAARGDLSAYKIGHVWRINRTDYLAWLKERRTKQRRTAISVAGLGSPVSKGKGPTFDDPLAPLLKQRPSTFLKRSKRNERCAGR